jgi:quercetin dioxygenase-like cupin family protein
MEHGMKRPTAKGPPDWFTGDVYVDAVAEGHGASAALVAFVHFTPGARTAWHRHSIGQSLYVTVGEGRIQARGEPITTLRPGDTVFAPGGEWHWHGAALASREHEEDGGDVRPY